MRLAEQTPAALESLRATHGGDAGARPAPRATPAEDWTRALETLARATRDPESILPRVTGAWAQKYGDRPALVSDRESFSFRALAARINRYSRWALSEGLPKGETFALMMGNRPEYFAIWMGLTQVGIVVALVSPDLRGAALTHALNVARARGVVAAAECVGACSDAIAGLAEPPRLWTHGAARRGISRIDTAVDALDGAALSASERRPVTLADRALRIFTSGTTGLPKAAEVSHRKLIAWTHWFAGLADMTSDDRLFNCLPMHHSVGGVVAVGAPLVNGGSVVIAERFSASRFWDDVARWECTAFQYIGELCRFLVASPREAAEPRRKLRLAVGNGLAPEVWRAFQERFAPGRILEFYASTEGNVWLYNVEGRVGSIGRTPPFLAARDPIALAPFDAERQAPERGEDGFCRRCGVGEIGEALGRIGDDAATRFEGYSQAAETERKILRDVFKPGDAWMRTGDLMRRDADGFYAFVDRIGDTFRWKGENVATLEVASVLAICQGVAEAIVYGVKVGGMDGRAGMALLRTTKAFSLDALDSTLAALPRYARPLFLRLAGEIERTETFKPVRSRYADEGFDPEHIRDPLYVFDGEREAYVALDAARYEAIQQGRMRL
jgi:fatty-acyl-CoA synthase